jgi:hypothetical protein
MLTFIVFSPPTITSFYWLHMTLVLIPSASRGFETVVGWRPPSECPTSRLTTLYASIRSNTSLPSSQF